MAYFKKNWPEDLHEDVLLCAEEVVQAAFYDFRATMSNVLIHTEV
jgi:hypothetical protein